MKIQNFIILSILSLSQLVYSQSPVVSKTNTLEEMVDNYFGSFPKYEKFSGVVLVAKGDQILFHKGYDLANREFGISNGKETRFQIGSITKAFTGMLVVKMVEEGFIDLNKTISDYLPYYPEETGRKITVNDLLSCTSGIPHHFEAVPDYWVSHDHYFHTSKELLTLFWDTPLKHEPGTEWTYSSPGFYILGAILQQVSKKSYAELLQEYIFQPLGMKNTFIENNRTTDINMATGYLRGLSGPVKAYVEDKSTALAAGDLVSTAYDLFLWQKTLNNEADQILSAESKKILFEPVLPNIEMTYAGPKFSIPYDEGKKNLTLCILNGSSSGYMTYLARIFEEDVCIIVLSNINDAEVNRIGDDIGDFYLRHTLGIEIGPEAPLTRVLPMATKLEKSSIEKKIGFYRQSAKTYIAAIQEEDKLYSLTYLKGAGIQRTMELIPFSQDTFYLSHDNRFRSVFSTVTIDGKLLMTCLRNGRAFAKAKKQESKEVVSSEYEGYFTSLEQQKTVKITLNSDGLKMDNLLGKSNIDIVYLDKDLFGFDRGYIEIRRDKNNEISEFIVFTKDTDRGFGSKFIKIVY